LKAVKLDASPTRKSTPVRNQLASDIKRQIDFIDKCVEQNMRRLKRIGR
jgi:hypothetical protein